MGLISGSFLAKELLAKKTKIFGVEPLQTNDASISYLKTQTKPSKILILLSGGNVDPSAYKIQKFIRLRGGSDC